MKLSGDAVRLQMKREKEFFTQRGRVIVVRADLSVTHKRINEHRKI